MSILKYEHISRHANDCINYDYLYIKYRFNVDTDITVTVHVKKKIDIHLILTSFAISIDKQYIHRRISLSIRNTTSERKLKKWMKDKYSWEE